MTFIWYLFGAGTGAFWTWLAMRDTKPKINTHDADVIGKLLEPITTACLTPGYAHEELTKLRDTLIASREKASFVAAHSLSPDTARVEVAAYTRGIALIEARLGEEDGE